MGYSWRWVDFVLASINDLRQGRSINNRHDSNSKTSDHKSVVNLQNQVILKLSNCSANHDAALLKQKTVMTDCVA